MSYVTLKSKPSCQTYTWKQAVTFQLTHFWPIFPFHAPPPPKTPKPLIFRGYKRWTWVKDGSKNLRSQIIDKRAQKCTKCGSKPGLTLRKYFIFNIFKMSVLVRETHYFVYFTTACRLISLRSLTQS